MEVTRAAIIDDEPARRRPQDADNRDPDDRDPRRWACRRKTTRGRALRFTLTSPPSPGADRVPDWHRRKQAGNKKSS